jgi:hypothetical protein
MDNKFSPSHVASFLLAIATGIDKSKQPVRKMVAADLKCAMDALEGNEQAQSRIMSVVGNTTLAADPVAPAKISFKGKFDIATVSKAIEHVASKRPDFNGRVARITIIAESVGE